MSVEPRPRVELVLAPRGWRRIRGTAVRIAAFALVELQKLRHDRTELVTRMVQPALWLLIFGQTFSRLDVIDTGDVPYLAFLAPGIIAQSALFISIFYGIQIVWDRDAGILAKLMVTPAPASAIVTGKAFAAGVRSVVQVIGVVALAFVLGVQLTGNPLKILAAMGVVVLGSAFFACLSMALAGLVRNRDRLMGIGQAITMPLFFASNALYPVDVMPQWLRWLSAVNPLSYEVNALRGLLIGTPANGLLDIAVLALAAVLGVVVASALLRRLVR
ncbi:transport permease protein [Mycolicibacterium parafortuitum]|uniref:Transport permease protein n=1 Tax=Mycolicibacterium parafortuitum TaxID=39692 RepID=A0A7I7U0H5_MYCPF|nr:ABC transporter permease [Mycolicibacterium parafortuitum]PQD98154.1 multidrug ABC transporter permease [Mycobacterium sp. EPG1]BBY74764.1 transport permease protein [Mycolicibacterium parafortuitum]